MKIKVSEATPIQLDYLVATCEGYDNLRKNPHAFDDALIMSGPQGNVVYLSYLNYSTNWAQGGPILEREGGTLWATTAAGWRHKARYNMAEDKEGALMRGPTPLIAAMRGHVASRLGDKVEIPEELK